MKIYYETNMNDLPKNCIECNMQHCRLGAKKNAYDIIIKNRYKNERHENCPLFLSPLKEIINELEEHQNIAIYASANATDIGDCLTQEGIEKGLEIAINLLKEGFKNDRT